MQIRNLLIRYLITFLILNIPILSANANFSRLYIFHINGINTSQEEAINNKVHLEKAAKVGYHTTTWALLYNRTHGLLKSDLFDVLRQKNQEHEELDIYDYVDAYMEAHDLHYPFYSTEYWHLMNHLKDYYAKDLDYVGKNFDDLLRQYHEIVAAGAKSIMSLLHPPGQNKHHMALFVPHSQGALYANSLIDYLIHTEDFPQEKMGVYAFASPATKMGYSRDDETPPIFSNHMTAYNDFVIKSLRVLSHLSPATDEPLSTNIHLNICNDNNFCHGLVTAYLANANAIRQFCVDVNRVAGHLISRS